MRVATFNVNSIKARLPFVLHWLAARQPDVALLQELKVPDDKFPSEAVAELGYEAHVHGQRQWNGVAVLSKQPGRVVQRGLPGAEDAGARLITVEVGSLSLTSVYVPNGKTVEHDDFAMKLEFMSKLVEYARSLPLDGSAIIGGDFNIVPQDIDSWSPERLRGQIFHTDAERATLAQLSSLGLTDLYRASHPEETMFSWWDYRAGCFHKNQGLRIDLLLGSAAIRDRVRGVSIDRDYRKKQEGETPSDHAPVTVELDAPAR